MTADLAQAAELDEMGPVDYIVLAFPTSRMTGEALPMLIDLVDRGVIRILDLVFLQKSEDGTVTTLSQVDLERMKVLEAALFEGATSGLLGAEELAEAAEALTRAPRPACSSTRTCGPHRSPRRSAAPAGSWWPRATSRSPRWWPPSTPWRPPSPRPPNPSADRQQPARADR
jgi:hypothetical protein